MGTISLCMIVRDEEDVLGRCLRCVEGIADEIVIVDTGSQDRTKEIAAGFTERIYDFPWQDDFAAARNFSFSKGVMDYILWLDADDVIDAENQQKLRACKPLLDADVVMMPYHVAFDAQGQPTFTYERERLLRRACGFRWEGAVHEVIVPAGRVVHSDIAICHRKERVHDPDRNLRIFEGLLARGAVLDARQQFYYARELYYHGRYAQALTAFDVFLHNPEGWVENRMDACLQAAGCCMAMDRREEALQYLFRSFLWDVPRAEICCEIGRLMMENGQMEAAVYWYECALHAELHPENGGFCQADCHDYIPLMQLCVLHDRMGNRRLARAYNERAGRIKPRDRNFLRNRQYFMDGGNSANPKQEE